MLPADSISEVTTLATDTAMTVWNGMSDFFIILVMLSAFFLFAWYIGRGQLVSIIIAYYCAYALYATFPFIDMLPSAPESTALFARAGLYLALVFIFYIILRRVVVSDFLDIGIFGLAALSFLASAFLILLAYHVFPIDSIYQFTLPIEMLFAPKEYFWWWFVAPAIGLFFLAR